MDDHAIFQELIFILFIYLCIYLFIYLFTSHVLYQSYYMLPQYPPATPRLSPFVLRPNKHFFLFYWPTSYCNLRQWPTWYTL